MSRPDYVLIVGQGRSGTNWLLELLDLSRETFCRNEPYGASSSPLNREAVARHRFIERPDQRLLEECWDEAANWTRLHMGIRDPRTTIRKDYLHEAARQLGLYRLVYGPRLRRVLSAVVPSLRGEEWKIPSWLGGREQLERSIAILKLVAPPGWATFVLRRRPGVPVLHIVRHPGGFLKSWSSRYAANEDPAKHLRENHRRLHEIASVAPDWKKQFGRIEDMSLDESELWYWYYANEIVFRAGSESTDYHHVIYEDLVQNPVAVMKPLYEVCGLQWNSAIEESVAQTGLGSDVAGAWREALSETQRALVDRFAVMARSFCAPT